MFGNLRFREVVVPSIDTPEHCRGEAWVHVDGTASQQGGEGRDGRPEARASVHMVCAGQDAGITRQLNSGYYKVPVDKKGRLQQQTLDRIAETGRVLACLACNDCLCNPANQAPDTIEFLAPTADILGLEEAS